MFKDVYPLKKKAFWGALINLVWAFLSFSPAYALEYTGVMNPSDVLSSINFRDVSGHWARDAIYRSAAQGITLGSQGGFFRPNDYVTKEQAITTLVGLKGLDAKAQQAAAEAAVSGAKWRDLSEYWGNGYVKVAVEEGILTPEEQQEVERERRSPATRQEVAAWSARCLDLDPAYGAGQQRLRSMKDWDKIKPAYMGYVAAVINENIMAGTGGGSFQPLKGVTRGEMAVIADKMSPRFAADRNVAFKNGVVIKKDESWQGANRGIVKNISFTVKENSGQNFVLVATEAPGNTGDKGFVVYRNKTLGLHNLLRQGDQVHVIVSTDGKILFVQVGSASPGSLQGTFAGLGQDKRTITIKDASGRDISYPLSSHVSVVINSQGASLEDLIHGQKVIVSVSGGQVTGIKGSTSSAGMEIYAPSANQIVEGVVRHIDSGSSELALSTRNGLITVAMDKSTQVVKDGSRIPASRIQVGDKVLAYIESGGASGSYVSRVQVAGARNSVGTAIKGIIQAVYPLEKKIILRDAREFFFGNWYPREDTLTLDVSSGGTVYLDAEAVDISWLAKAGIGASLYAAVDEGSARALKATARSGSAEMFNGLVEEVDWAAGSLDFDNGPNVLYGPDSIVLRDGRLMDAGDIEDDVYVFAETNLVDNFPVGALIVWEDFYHQDFEIARGRLEEVEEDSFELEDYCEYKDNSWDNEESSEDLDLSPDAYIIDATDGSNPKVIEPEDFSYSRFGEKYEDAFVTVVSRDGLVEEMIISQNNFTGQKTSVARIASANGKSMTLDRVSHWSEAQGQWKESGFPLTLDVSCALVYKGDELVGKGTLHIGDAVYVVHNMEDAAVIFIQ